MIKKTINRQEAIINGIIHNYLKILLIKWGSSSRGMRLKKIIIIFLKEKIKPYPRIEIIIK